MVLRGAEFWDAEFLKCEFFRKQICFKSGLSIYRLHIHISDNLKLSDMWNVAKEKIHYEKIKSGETFTTENIWVKRPGTGQIMADKYESIIGKVAKKSIPNDHHLSWNDIE